MAVTYVPLCTDLADYTPLAILSDDPYRMQPQHLLFISNSSNGIYLYGGNGNLLTTKTSNKNEHGIGIKRINEIVKKYNGIIEFDPGTEIFSVSILFPLDN